MNRPVRCAAPAAAMVAVVMLAGCGATTVVGTTTTTPSPAEETTTTLPSGSVEQLLGNLRETVFLLSTAIVDGNGKQQFAAIEATWRAAAAQLPRTTFRESTQYQIELMRNAVERKRPADADKASLQVRALIDNELARDPD